MAERGRRGEGSQPEWRGPRALLFSARPACLRTLFIHPRLASLHRQTDFHTALSAKVDAALGIEGGAFAKGQLRSYMRTPVAYYVAQLVSQAGNPCIVMGTGNKDEDGARARGDGGAGGRRG